MLLSVVYSKADFTAALHKLHFATCRFNTFMITKSFTTDFVISLKL